MNGILWQKYEDNATKYQVDLEDSLYCVNLQMFLSSSRLTNNIMLSESLREQETDNFIGKFIEKDNAHKKILDKLSKTDSCVWFLDPVTMKPVSSLGDEFTWLRLSMVKEIWYVLGEAIPSLIPVLIMNGFSKTVGLYLDGGDGTNKFLEYAKQEGFELENQYVIKKDNSTAMWVHFKHPGLKYGYTKDNYKGEDIVLNGQTFEGVKILTNGMWAPLPKTIRFMADENGQPAHEIFDFVNPQDKQPEKKDVPFFLLQSFVDTRDTKTLRESKNPITY